MPSLRSTLIFVVPEEVPHRLLTEATKAGLAAARIALAPEGSADANGRLGRAGDGARRVTIEIELRPGGRAPAVGLAAERAFVEAFVAPLVRRGFDVKRP